MADPSGQSSLNVLSGPEAGTRFIFEQAEDDLLLGSDPSCRLRLTGPEVGPVHAKIRREAGGAVVYAMDSGRGVYVNDDRVVEKAPLRNGDILWLGTPGEQDAVMIQCRLPPAAANAAGSTLAAPEPATAASPIPAEVAPEPAEVMDAGSREGLEEVLEPEVPEAWADEPAAAPAASVPALEPETPAASSAEAFWFEEAPSAPAVQAEAFPPAAEPEAPGEPVEAFLAEDLETAMAAFPTEAPPSEPEVVDHEVVEEGLPAETYQPLPPPAPGPAAPVFEDELAETVSDVPAPSLAPAPPPPAPERPAAPPQPPLQPMAPPPPPRSDVSPPATALAAPPPARAEPPSPPARPSPPPSSARPETAAVPPPRKAPSPPSPAKPAQPRPARTAPIERPAARRKPASSGPPVALLAVGGLLVLGVGGFLAMRAMRGGETAPVVSEPPPAGPEAAPPTLAAAPVPPATLAAAREDNPPPPATLAPAPVPQPATTFQAAPVPPARPLASPIPTAQRPPATIPLSLRPPVATGAPPPGSRRADQPSAEAVKAQQLAAQVGALVSQADGALAARNYDAAVGFYDEVLKLEPQNQKAAQGKKAALAAREAARHTFVSGTTVVRSGKDAKGGLAGFDTSGVSVKQSSDFSGRLELAMSPTVVKPGDSYALKVYLLNDGKKEIKVAGLTFTTSVNGKKSSGPLSPRVKEVAPQQRALLQELQGVWPEGVGSWSTEILVSANKGDSLRNQLTWK